MTKAKTRTNQPVTTGLKVLENLAVNEDGTIVQIGGNVAFESIEQLGTAIEVEPTKSRLEQSESFPPSGTGVIATNVKNVVMSSGFTSGGIPFVTLEPNQIGYGEYAIVYRDGNGVYHQCFGGKFDPSATSEYIEFDGDIQVETFAGLTKGQEGGLRFTPFFTEEQYQALLDLIA